MKITKANAEDYTISYYHIHPSYIFLSRLYLTHAEFPKNTCLWSPSIVFMMQLMFDCKRQLTCVLSSFRGVGERQVLSGWTDQPTLTSVHRRWLCLVVRRPPRTEQGWSYLDARLAWTSLRAVVLGHVGQHHRAPMIIGRLNAWRVVATSGFSLCSEASSVSQH